MIVLRSFARNYNFLLKLKLKFRCPPNLLFPVYSMSTLSNKLKSDKLKKDGAKTQIISLLSDQLEQLTTLTHYEYSMKMLEKNELLKSYEHLEHALTEAKALYSQSINLHLFLLNRMSILQKLLGESDKFVETLQQIFFMSLSLKGDKSLETIRNFHNYLIGLILWNPNKLEAIIEYVKQQNPNRNTNLLLKRSKYLISICKYLIGLKQESIQELQEYLSQDESKKYQIINNLSWFKLLAFTNQTLEGINQDNKDHFTNISKELIKALLQAESNPQASTDQKYIQRNLQMTNALSLYLEKNINGVLKIRKDTILLNSQSHIIMMNLAYSLYLQKKYHQSAHLMKIGLETAIELKEPYRLGMGIILLAKINNKLKIPSEPILLNILRNRKVYSKSVLKQTLLIYSRFLAQEKRFFEAEEYAQQSLSITGNNFYIEGLVLPDFDFSF